MFVLNKYDLVFGTSWFALQPENPPCQNSSPFCLPVHPAVSTPHSRPGCCHVWPPGWSADAQSHCPKSPRHNLMHKPIKRQEDSRKGKEMLGHFNYTCFRASVPKNKIRMQCPNSVTLRGRFSHELWLTVTPSQEDRWTEIVLLLIHSLNSIAVVSHRV